MKAKPLELTTSTQSSSYIKDRRRWTGCENSARCASRHPNCQKSGIVQSDCPTKAYKPTYDPKGYQPIPLLCMPYKILEHLIYTHLDPVINPKLSKEQAGFCCGRSTTNQVTILTQDMEDTFQVGKKAAVILLDLTAAYNTVWLREQKKKRE